MTHARVALAIIRRRPRANPAPLALARVGWWDAGRGQGRGPATGVRRRPRAGEVEALAKKVGLGPFRSSRTAHYLGLGNAPEGFLTQALAICEGVARDYLDYYQGKGFEVESPARRLTVVALADARDFAAFLGSEPGAGIGGIYDLGTNWLVIFDFRGEDRSDVRQPEKVNTIALVHEATHQLTFNTGLLDRRGDVPMCISEGLAMFGEMRDIRRPNLRTPPGQDNPRRLEALVLEMRQGVPWIAVPKLIEGDAILTGDSGEETQQLAYAESWLLVSHLLKTPAKLPGFRAYLKAIRGRRDAQKRLDDAQAHLGDLDRLDADLRKYAARLTRRSL